ncbi:MAG: hypothetical protein JNK05_23905 [Myxococcales bacterium]|nr:hypothetical protein [Myxococcales bacterium]
MLALSALGGCGAMVRPASPAGMSQRTAVRLSAGVGHSCALQPSGEVFCWGLNERGQAGAPLSMERATSAFRVPNINNAVSIAAGAFHACALLADGSVRCWGNRATGALGDSMSGESSPTPVRVIGVEDAVSISAGNYHTCALTAGQRVFCWGNNHVGQLGLGTEEMARLEAAEVPSLRAMAIAAGGDDTCAIDDQSRLLCWGSLSRVFEDRPTRRPRLIEGATDVLDVQIGNLFTCVRRRDETVWCFGNNHRSQLGRRSSGPAVMQVPGFDQVIQLAAGFGHVCGLIRDGSVRCVGWNAYGQSGWATNESQFDDVRVARELSGVRELAAGNNHTLVRLADGSVWCFGDDGYGQCGDGVVGEPASRPTPVRVRGL